MSNHPHRRPPKPMRRPAEAEAPELPPMPEELEFFSVAWRLYGLDHDGTLVAPFVDRYWPGSADDRTWPVARKNATCIASDHEAPVEDCSCGIAGVKSWPAFIAAVTSQHFDGSSVPVIEECQVMAMVELAGRAYPSSEPHDPPSTFRAEQATVRAIHMAPSVSAATAQAVADRYRDCRCYVHTEDQWPDKITRESEQVWPTPTEADVAAFVADIRKVGFGTVSRKKLADVSLSLAKNAVEALRAGASPEDLASVLFDSNAKPTFAQARALILAATEHLAPGLNLTNAGYQHARPILKIESATRPMEQFAHRFGAGSKQ